MSEPTIAAHFDLSRLSPEEQEKMMTGHLRSPKAAKRKVPRAEGNRAEREANAAVTHSSSFAPQAGWHCSRCPSVQVVNAFQDADGGWRVRRPRLWGVDKDGKSLCPECNREKGRRLARSCMGVVE